MSDKSEVINRVSREPIKENSKSDTAGHSKGGQYALGFKHLFLKGRVGLLTLFQNTIFSRPTNMNLSLTSFTSTNVKLRLRFDINLTLA